MNDSDKAERAANAKKDIEVFTEAKRLLLEKGWTRDTSARDSQGKHAYVLGEHAACFCAAGAIDRASANLSSEGSYSRCAVFLDDVIAKGPHAASIPRYRDPTLWFNDVIATCAADVAAVFDECIERLKADV